MRIGILTFHCAHNYGAVLQAYALQEYLKEMGHEVYILDYRPEYLTKSYQRSLPLNLKELSIPGFIRNLALEPFVAPFLKRRFNNFDDFIKRYLNLRPYDNAELTKYDAVILGSDQIWSPNLTGGKFDDNYFAANAKCRIISYAASSNKPEFNDEEKKYISTQLARFHAISVREKTLEQQLCKFIRSKIYTVVDPTILAGRSIFENLIADSPNTSQDYVLSFELNPYKEVRMISQHIANQLDCKVVHLSGYPFKNRIYNSITAASPVEMLRLVRDARCIVTSSFHGSALSLIFEKPFYVVRKGNGGDARFVSMLNEFGIPERVINKTDRPQFSEIDYGASKGTADRKVFESKEFINTALQ